MYGEKDMLVRHQPLIGTDVKGSMVTATRGSQSVTRNMSFFKAINTNLQYDSTDAETEEYIHVEMPNGSETLTENHEQRRDNRNEQRHDVQNEQGTRRYPSRTRTPPTYLQDYVTKLHVQY